MAGRFVGRLGPEGEAVLAPIMGGAPPPGPPLLRQPEAKALPSSINPSTAWTGLVPIGNLPFPAIKGTSLRPVPAQVGRAFRHGSKSSVWKLKSGRVHSRRCAAGQEQCPSRLVFL